MAGVFQPQGQLFFASAYPQNPGWSEVYWPIGGNYAAALANMNLIRDARIAMLPADCFWEYTRVSDVNVPGDAIVDAGYIVGTFGGGDTHTMDLRLALLERVNAGNQRHAMKYLHGIPSTQFTAGKYVPTVPFTAAIAAWAAATQVNSQYAYPNPAPPPRKVVTPITDINFIRVTTRHVGRPFGLLVGRRRTA